MTNKYVISLMLISSLVYSEELTKEQFDSIITAKHSDDISEPLKHYKKSDSFTIEKNINYQMAQKVLFLDQGNNGM